MHSFGKAKLGDMVFPVISHRKRWAIHLGLRKILQRKISYSCSPLSRPPPSPLQCTSRGRSCIGASSCHTSARENIQEAHSAKPVRAAGSASASCPPLWCCLDTSPISMAFSLTVTSHLAISLKGNGRPNARGVACCSVET